jgi:hypothetical protein
MSIFGLIKLIYENKFKFILFIFLFLLVIIIFDNYRTKKFAVETETYYKLNSDLFVAIKKLQTEISIYDNLEIQSNFFNIPFKSSRAVDEKEYFSNVKDCLTESGFINNNEKYDNIKELIVYEPGTYFNLAEMVIKAVFITTDPKKSLIIFNKKLALCNKFSLDSLLIEFSNDVYRYKKIANLYSDYFESVFLAFNNEKFKNNVEATNIFTEAYFFNKTLSQILHFDNLSLLEDKILNFNIKNFNENEYLEKKHNFVDIKIHETVLFLYIILSIIVATLAIIIINYKKLLNLNQ